MDPNTDEKISGEGTKGKEYTELGIPVSEGDQSKQGEYLDRVYDQMLTTAELNFFRRPVIESFDSLGHKVSWVTIPTLEDLKCSLYEPSGLIPDLGPEKVITLQDIETAACISDYYQNTDDFFKKYFKGAQEAA
jgi:hypothetical protein